MEGSDLRGFDVILLKFQWKNSFWISRNPCVFRHFILVQLDLSIPRFSGFSLALTRADFCFSVSYYGRRLCCFLCCCLLPLDLLLVFVFVARSRCSPSFARLLAAEVRPKFSFFGGYVCNFWSRSLCCCCLGFRIWFSFSSFTDGI
jgi:hypothetical protein